MSEEHGCLYEERWGKVLTQLENISSKVCRHIEEGECEGGFRDRLLMAERSISELKKAMWGRVVVSGIIGGLIGGKIAPEFLNWLLKLIVK